MQIQYTNDRPIVQGNSIALALQAYLAKKSIAKNELAKRITISAPGLHYLLTGKNELTERRIRDITEVLGIEIRINGKICIHETDETEIKLGRKIGKADIDNLEYQFYAVNSELIDADVIEIDSYTLQEYILESECGLNVLLAHLTRDEKARINDIGNGNSLTDKIRDLHRRNGEIVLNPDRILRLAVRAHLRAHIGGYTGDLKSSYFPGEYVWDLSHETNNIPF